jgi:hypothetical protein
MSRHHTHRTKRAHRHRKEFFQREPRHWSVGDFVTYEFRKLPQPTTSTGRSILRSWTDKLKAISKCKRKGCCSKTRRNRATNLYEAYKQTVRFDLRFTPLFFSVADSGELYAPQSGLYVRFGLRVIIWHLMARTFCSAQPVSHVRHGLSISDFGDVHTSSKRPRYSLLALGWTC